MSEGRDFLPNCALVDLGHLPAEVHLDSTLVALVQSDLVRVWELEDLVIGSEVVDLSRLLGSSVELVHAVERFVVESIEVVSFSLIRSFR